MTRNPHLVEIPECKAHRDYFDFWEQLVEIFPYQLGQAGLDAKFGKKDARLRMQAFVVACREWFTTDLYALMRFCLSCADYVHASTGTRYLDKPWCFKMVRKTSRLSNAGKLHRLLRYFFRGGFKTTTVNALILQRIFKDPDIRIIYYSRTADLAVKRSSYARKELEGNPLIHLLWPHISWGPNYSELAANWSEGEWTVQRTSRKGKAGAEPTMQTSGIMSGLKTGGHPTLFIFDDIEDDENAHSPTQAAKTVKRVMAADKISDPSRETWYVGTIYNKNGPLTQLRKERYITKIWVESALDFDKPVKRYGKPTKEFPNALDIGGAEPVFYTAGELKEWRGVTQQSWREYALQYLCRVDLVQAAELDADLIQWGDGSLYDVASNSNLYGLGDPGGFPELARTSQLSDSVLLIAALSPDRHIRIIDGFVTPAGSAKRGRKVMSMTRRWMPYGHFVEWRYEEGGTGGDTSFIADRQMEEGFLFRVVRVTRGGGPGAQSKAERQFSLVEPLLEKLIVPKHVMIDHRGERKNLGQLIVQAVAEFPAQDLGDILDALALLSEPTGRPVKVLRGSSVIDEVIEPLKWPSENQRFLRKQHGPTLVDSLPSEDQYIASMFGLAGVPASQFSRSTS